MTTRIALIGAGGVAQRHAEVLRSFEDAQIVSVIDPVPEAGAALAAACGAQAYTDLDAGLDAQPVDAAYVCVPPFAHGEPERAVIARGLPFFVEKPLATEWDDAAKIAEEVERSGLVTGTGYHWRCLDVVEEARSLLSGSAPVLASGYWLDKRPPVPWWGRTDRSGGQVVEQATHVLDLARSLLGEAVQVFAAGTRRRDQPDDASFDVDDATAATVRFASGAVATLAATSVLGAKHRAALHTYSPGLVLEMSETGMVVHDGDGRRDRAAAQDPKYVVDREFVDAVRGERPATRAPYAEALRTHRLACAVAESARTGEAVTL